MDRSHNVYGTPKITPNKRFEKSDGKRLKHSLLMLNAKTTSRRKRFGRFVNIDDEDEIS